MKTTMKRSGSVSFHENVRELRKRRIVWDADTQLQQTPTVEWGDLSREIQATILGECCPALQMFGTADTIKLNKNTNFLKHSRQKKKQMIRILLLISKKGFLSGLLSVKHTGRSVVLMAPCPFVVAMQTCSHQKDNSPHWKRCNISLEEFNKEIMPNHEQTTEAIDTQFEQVWYRDVLAKTVPDPKMSKFLELVTGATINCQHCEKCATFMPHRDNCACNKKMTTDIAETVLRYFGRWHMLSNFFEACIGNQINRLCRGERGGKMIVNYRNDIHCYIVDIVKLKFDRDCFNLICPKHRIPTGEIFNASLHGQVCVSQISYKKCPIANSWHKISVNRRFCPNTMPVHATSIQELGEYFRKYL